MTKAPGDEKFEDVWHWSQGGRCPSAADHRGDPREILQHIYAEAGEFADAIREDESLIEYAVCLHCAARFEEVVRALPAPQIDWRPGFAIPEDFYA